METTPEFNNEAAVARKGHSFLATRAGFALAVILIDVIAIWLMLFYGKQNGNDDLTKLGYDTIKLSIQLILIVLFGGIFIQEYNRSRARKTAMNDFRRTTLRNLSRAYSDIKGVRRILRAKCQSVPQLQFKTVGDCLPLAAYDEHIATINATQLELEILVRELKIIKEVFENTDALIGYITSMEEYIKEVVSEYETESKKHRGSDSVPLSKLPRLSALIARRTESTDFRVFAEGYDKALTIIQEERIRIA
jgi:hypothetical protein